MSNNLKDENNRGSSASTTPVSVKAGTVFSIIGDRSKAFESLSTKSGFDCYAIVDISHVQNEQIRPIILQNNMPIELLQAFLSAGAALGQCSLFEVLVQTDSPFAWKTGYNAATGEKSVLGEAPLEDMFDQLLETFNILFGRCVPVRNANQQKFVVVYMGALEVAEEEYPGLDASSTKEFSRLFGNKKSIDAPNSVNLSNIETNCFQMLADGFSRSQIATRNNISDQTLNLLFTNVCKKLSATNLAHALILLYTSDSISA